METALAFIAAVLGAGGIGAVLKYLVARKKAAADAAETIVRAAEVLVDPLRREIEELREELSRERAQRQGDLEEHARLLVKVNALEEGKATLERENRELKRRVAHLETELEAVRGNSARPGQN